jgi:hypothetical protein
MTCINLNCGTIGLFGICQKISVSKYGNTITVPFSFALKFASDAQDFD